MENIRIKIHIPLHIEYQEIESSVFFDDLDLKSKHN